MPYLIYDKPPVISTPDLLADAKEDEDQWARAQTLELLENLDCAGSRAVECGGLWLPPELIREDHFTSYVEAEILSAYDIPDFIAAQVNWDALADAHRTDFKQVEVNGTTYLFRA